MQYCHECTQAGLEYELNLAGIEYTLDGNIPNRQFYIECQNKIFTIDFSQQHVATLTYNEDVYKTYSFARIVDIIKENTK